MNMCENITSSAEVTINAEANKLFLIEFFFIEPFICLVILNFGSCGPPYRLTAYILYLSHSCNIMLHLYLVNCLFLSFFVSFCVSVDFIFSSLLFGFKHCCKLSPHLHPIGTSAAHQRASLHYESS